MAFRLFGAKTTIVDELIPRFPRRRHSRFIDVFGGSGTIVNHKPPHKEEIFNDRHRDVFNVFEILRHRDERERLYDQLNHVVYSRVLYERCGEILRRSVDRVERAFAFLFLQHVGYCGCTGSFCNDNRRRARHQNLAPNLDRIRWRFQHVLIENLDWCELVAKYASYDTFGYFDPPYAPVTRTNEHVYRHEMSMGEHEAMLRYLTTCEMPIMLSGYDCALYRDYLNHWRSFTVETRSFASYTRARRVEKVWMNYDKQGELLSGKGPREEENDKPDTRPPGGWEWEVPSRDNALAKCLSVAAQQIEGLPVPEDEEERAILREAVEQLGDRLKTILLRIK